MSNTIDAEIDEILLSFYNGVEGNLDIRHGYPPIHMDEAKAKLSNLINKAVDRKLQTLQEAVPLLDLCEDDANKILIWAKNHRWSLVAPTWQRHDQLRAYRRSLMGKLEVCDLCKQEIMARYEDTAYKFIVKKRWHSYDGFVPYREKTKLDICFDCMRKIIEATQKGNSNDSK